MVRIEFDAAFVEAVVFAEIWLRGARGELRIVRNFREELDAAYGDPPGDARDHKSRAVHSSWFSRLRLDRPVVEAASQLGLLSRRLERIFVHGVLSAQEEGADLMGMRPSAGSAEILSAVLRIRSQRYADFDCLTGFLLHEFQLVSDLLSEGFSEARASSFPSGPARERYRLLWEIHADGRLAQRGLRGLRPKEEWKSLFSKGFGFLGASYFERAFEWLWISPVLTHAQLYMSACDPRASLAEERGSRAPGTQCPLCRFPTHVWASADVWSGRPDVRDLIQARFVHWSPDDGVCGECYDRFVAVADSAALA